MKPWPMLSGWTASCGVQPDCPRGLKRLLGAGHHVKLPSEAEWEKAARGTDGRIWPWGQRFEKERLNGADPALSDVSPVGCFPTGATPDGLQDMAGNVWEWTRSALADYPYSSGDGRESLDRQIPRCVLRGGSFGVVRRAVRCARSATSSLRGIGSSSSVFGCRSPNSNSVPEFLISVTLKSEILLSAFSFSASRSVSRLPT